MTILCIAIFLCLLISITCINNEKELVWMFITAHKTGTHFVLDAVINGTFGYCVSPTNKIKISFGSMISPRIQNSSIAYFGCPAKVQRNWVKELTVNPNKIFRVIHFIRDPLNLILSAYLYHSQPITPETFLTHPVQYCVHDIDLEEIIDAFSRYKPSLRAELPRWFRDMKADCVAMQDKFPNNMAFADVLKNAPRILPPHNTSNLYPAIKIQALQSLADCLLIVHRFMYEDQSIVKHFLTEDFSGSMPTRFKQSTKDMLQFLYNPYVTTKNAKEKIKCKFCDCIGIEEAEKRIIKNGMITVSNSSMHAHGAHITRDFMSLHDRAYYQGMLMRDKYLGKLFRLLSEILRSNFTLSNAL